jgi:serine/threonine protein kinase, bacterial
VQGTSFGQYRLVTLLGRGGMGEVWRAYDTTLDREIALKVLPADLADDDTFVERFRREAQAAAMLNAPHVIPIHGFGEIEGRLYVDMRLIEGSDIEGLLRSGPLDPGRAVRLVSQVAGALDAAHRAGLIHRDVKPSNVLVDGNDFAYLIDFGIARSSGQAGLTSTGMFLGTLAYMAPERFTTGQVDHRADVYALACVLFECLTARRPFEGDGVEQQAAGHMFAEPPRPSQWVAGVPVGLDAVIATGMAKGPGHRYGTALELARAAEAALNTPVSTVAPPTQYGTPPTPYGTQVQRHSPFDNRAPTPASVSPRPSAVPWWRRKPVIIGAASVVVVVVVATIAIGLGGTSDDIASSTSPAALGPAGSSASSAPATPVVAPGTQTVLPVTNLNNPLGLALDGAGALMVNNNGARQVLKLPSGNAPAAVLPFPGADTPNGIAVDAAGNVYVAYSENPRVVKLAPGADQPVDVPFTGLLGPFAIGVDGAGNVYVSDFLLKQVVKLDVATNTQTVLPFTGLGLPMTMAVNSAGNVVVGDVLNHRVVQVAPGASSQTDVPIQGLSTELGSLYGLAYDSAGNLYAADANNNRIVELVGGTGPQKAVPFTDLYKPAGVAVDAVGNTYVSDTGHGRILKLTPGW